MFLLSSDVISVYLYTPGGRSDQAADHLDSGGLACSVWAQEAHNPAGVNVKRYSIDGGYASVFLCQVLYFNHAQYVSGQSRAAGIRRMLVGMICHRETAQLSR